MKTKLKILHTESHPHWGGQEMRVFNESRWMHSQGHHIIIIAPQNSVIYKKANKEGWETHPISFKRSGMISDAFRIRKLLRKICPDVLNTHGNTDGKVALTAAYNLGIPCVIHSRHSSPAVRNSWYNRLLYKDLCDFTFTTANIIKEQLVRDLSIPEQHIFSIPSAFIPPADMPEREQSRKNLAAEAGLNPDTRFIGCVGRLAQGKGLDILINAFVKSIDIIPEYHLVLVGEGHLLSSLKDQVEKNHIRDKVHFTGFQDNPWPYFRALDCHILASSQYEAVPQVIPQAMYAQCPVIGTDTGGIPDIIIHEETGLLVPPEDTRQLAEAILKIIKEPDSAKKRAEKAFEYAKNNHTIDIMGQKILQIYNTKTADMLHG